MRFNQLSKKELIKLTNEVLEEIDKRKAITKEEFIKKGYIKKDERLTYENIDMTDIEEKLLQILYSYHINSTYNLISSERAKLERVCLAAMCQFIKSEYHIKGYTTDYYNLTKIQFDNKMYKILENSFKREGILPDNWDNMRGFRFKDTLINETGIPKHLTIDLIDLFKVYWKNLREFDFSYVFENYEILVYKNYIVDVNDENILKNNLNKLREYPKKVNKVIKQLSEVCKILEYGNYYEEDLLNEDVINGINKILKFDILSILPRKDSLKNLYIQILSKISINKFNNILIKLDDTTRLRLPNKTEKTIKNYKNIQLGIHNMNEPIYRIYTVLPYSFLSIKVLKNLKEDQFTKIDKLYIGYKSNKRFDVNLGKYRLEKSYPLYEDGTLQGYYWVGKIKDGIPIIINNNIYESEKFISYKPIFKYNFNEENSMYSYNLILNNLKLYLYSYRNKDLAIKCSHSDEIKYIRIDRDGYIKDKSVDFILNKKILEESIKIYVYHYENSNYDILYSEKIENIEDINLYTKSLIKNNYEKTEFEYRLDNKDWKFKVDKLFHIEKYRDNRYKIVTNIKNAIDEIEVISMYNEKYKRLYLKDIVDIESKKIFINDNKLRELLDIKNHSAKIKLLFMHKYDKIFAMDVLSIKNLNVSLDKEIYIEGEAIKICIEYNGISYYESAFASRYKIGDKKITKFIPVTVYIDDIDSYYTQYIKPNIIEEQRNILNELNKNLKWYEIEDIYTNENLKKDIVSLGNILKTI